MTAIVAVDIGGTHARFAIAEVQDGCVIDLGKAVTLKTAEYGSFQTAWQEFKRLNGASFPRAVAIAIAGPVDADVIELTNNPWIIHRSMVCEKLDVDNFVIVNDFGAVGYAVAHAGAEHFQYLAGPEQDFAQEGTISIIGPGTGLGVAHLWRQGSNYHVQATQGGHIDFAPLDAIEDAVLARLRKRYRRVSIERVVSGPGLVNRPFLPVAWQRGRRHRTRARRVCRRGDCRWPWLAHKGHSHPFRLCRTI